MTGVGVRTLQRSFREYFDVTITEFMKHGFNHFGRFSVLFREHYGVSPGEVLALRAGCKS